MPCSIISRFALQQCKYYVKSAQAAVRFATRSFCGIIRRKWMRRKQTPGYCRGKTLEELGNGRWIIQHPDVFAFGTDAVLLAHFAQTTGAERARGLRHRHRHFAPARWCARNPKLVITGVEIQPRPAEMALRSVELNGLEGRVNIICGDLKAAPRLVGRGLDVVVSNPPYERARLG